MSAIPNEEYKRRRIIQAVKEDDVPTLQTHLTPDLYNICDEHGYTLLQRSVFYRNISNNSFSAFEYLLSLEDYPIDAVNKYGKNALLTSLINMRCFSVEYVARRLIQRGVDIHAVCCGGKSALHYCFLLHRVQYLNTALLLVEKGMDVNRQDYNGNTPLQLCCERLKPENLAEGVAMLLYYGADPTVRNEKGHTAFDYLIVRHSYHGGGVEENLFYYLFDDYTEYDIDAELLLGAAVAQSSLFEQLLKKIRKVFFNNDRIGELWCKLFVMKPKYLRIFIEKFDHVIIEILNNTRKPLWIHYIYWGLMSVENFYILFESKLQSEFVEWLCEIDTCDIIEHCISYEISEVSLTELVCFLLSYEMAMPTKYLDLIFEKFGYCELVKILLHMDLTFSHDGTSVMPRLLYDFNVDAQKLIQDPLTLTVKDLRQILPYFAIPKLKNMSSEELGKHKDVMEKIQKQPTIPLLIEMARDVFRRHFVQKLNIANARQFYTQLNLLPINNCFKKIISLERKLY